ncbi:MAG TPA: hypothetical protein VFW71_15780 [Actinomycetota bacterium]|nr:hypothetical protein [Actinomycetota bacterium]
MADQAFAAAGVVDRTGRSVLEFTGDQALWFCDQLLSNQLVGLPEGTGLEALLLTPHGKVTALLRLLHSGDRLLADGEPGLGEGLRQFFEGRRFATRVEIRDITATTGVLSVVGPQAGAICAAVFPVLLDGQPGGEEHDSVAVGPVVVARTLRPAPGLDVLGPREELAAILASLLGAGASPATLEDYDALRVECGVARDQVDIDEGLLPQEAALERAVHFAKGCYLGQEAVAMTQRGRIKRRLRHLAFDGPARRGVVTAGDEEAGRVSSVTPPGQDPGFGIALVRTSVGIGDRVAVTDEAGRRTVGVVGELAGSVSGPALPSARELRESLGR